VFLINDHPMFREGLALFKNFLIKSCSDDIQETVELRALLDVLQESSDLLEGKGNGRGKVFLKLVKELPMFQAGLALFFALAAVEAEVERKDVRQFHLVRFEGLLDEEKPSSRRNGFVTGCAVSRASSHTRSALSTSEDIFRDLFEPLRDDGYPLSKGFLRDDGEELEEEPLGY
jgi:hypothetical protein